MDISLPAVPISLSRYSGRGCRLGGQGVLEKGDFQWEKKTEEEGCALFGGATLDSCVKK